MKLSQFLRESKKIRIRGIEYSLNSDEERLYNKIKSQKILYKKDISEYDVRILNNMVSKGYIRRCKNRNGEIYFIAKGRNKALNEVPLKEVAPPSQEAESWIKKNKEKFKEKYGKDYEKYLYGHAWKMFNGKK